MANVFIIINYSFFFKEKKNIACQYHSPPLFLIQCSPRDVLTLRRSSPISIPPTQFNRGSRHPIMASSLMLTAAARLPSSSFEIRAAPRGRSAAAFTVRAEGGINPDVRKNEEKVVDSVVAAELTKPLTAYCRYSPRSPPPPCSSLQPSVLIEIYRQVLEIGQVPALRRKPRQAQQSHRR